MQKSFRLSEGRKGRKGSLMVQHTINSTFNLCFDSNMLTNLKMTDSS